MPPRFQKLHGAFKVAATFGCDGADDEQPLLFKIFSVSK